MFFKQIGNRPINLTLSQNLISGIWFSLFVFKLICVLFFLIEDTIRLLHWLYNIVFSLITKTSFQGFSSRRSFITSLGLFTASVPFLGLLYGITKGKYLFDVKKLKLKLPHLPKPFEGFRIVQISDFHAGSFDDFEQVKKGFEKIKALQPDIILFTGDLVNNRSDEVKPYVSLFSELTAPYGKFGIMGNHDYGDYVQWASKEEKQANFNRFKDYYQSMGFHLLLNQHQFIEKDGDRMVLTGVENWGAPPFKQYGDLSKATAGIPSGLVHILLSHDPSHWDAEIKNYSLNIDLTLSGHTHGMQFGVDIPGWKWSPVKLKYPKWSGLYTENNKHLYVNKGFGFLGFPGRVGMWPEITAIDLTRS